MRSLLFVISLVYICNLKEKERWGSNRKGVDQSLQVVLFLSIYFVLTQKHMKVSAKRNKRFPTD